MKRLLAALIAMMMLVCFNAYAITTEEMTIEELQSLVAQLQEELAAYKGEDVEEPAEDTVEEPKYTDLPKGSKGEEAKKLQIRLIELGYLTGSADGIYGNGTAAAVSAFQQQHDLDVTGNADVATQEILFSNLAKKAIVYEKLDYKGVSRDPDNYTDRHVKFTGKVLQVIEYNDYGVVSFRVATKGNYDDVVYVMYVIPEKYSRILEDDRIEISGTYGELYSYETVRGDTVTIPLVYAELITLK